MSSSFLDETNTKALIAAGVAASIDIFIYKNTNYKATALLAGCVATGSFGASKIAPSLTDITGGSLGVSTMYDIKTIEQRLIELSISSGSSFVLSKYAFKNMRNLPMIEYIAIFGGSSFIAEYATDYIFKKPLSYLS